MTNKQILNSLYSPDGSKYGCITNGNGTLVSTSTSVMGPKETLSGSQARDGSIYFTLTNGSGALV